MIFNLNQLRMLKTSKDISVCVAALCANVVSTLCMAELNKSEHCSSGFIHMLL